MACCTVCGMVLTAVGMQSHPKHLQLAPVFHVCCHSCLRQNLKYWLSFPSDYFLNRQHFWNHSFVFMYWKHSFMSKWKQVESDRWRTLSKLDNFGRKLGSWRWLDKGKQETWWKGRGCKRWCACPKPGSLWNPKMCGCFTMKSPDDTTLLNAFCSTLLHTGIQAERWPRLVWRGCQ